MVDELIKRLRERDNDAFEEVYEMYNIIVFFVILQIVKDVEASHDITQETFLTMYNKIEQFSGEGNFKYWLLQIAKNKSKNYITKVKREREIVNNNIIYYEENDEPMYEEDIIEKIKGILDPVSFEIINLKIFDNSTFSEISEKMNMNISSIYRRYNKAIEDLKEHFEK